MKIFDLLSNAFHCNLLLYSLYPCEIWSFSIRIACYVYLQVLNLWQISIQFCLDCLSLAREKLSAHLPLNVHKTTMEFFLRMETFFLLHRFEFVWFWWISMKNMHTNFPVALACVSVTRFVAFVQTHKLHISTISTTAEKKTSWFN